MTKMMSVQVKKCQMRNQPSFMGKIVSHLAYGDQVNVLEDKDAWLKVQSDAGRSSGWVHSSALSTKKIVLGSGSKDVPASASSQEIALAGKGFNQQVEKEYRKQNSNVDFSWIDKMEDIVISPAEIHSFLQEGGVTPEGGRS